jgi:predicted AAA+ superfamily ATPase
MNKFPTPPPDRRYNKINSNSRIPDVINTSQTNDPNSYETSEPRKSIPTNLLSHKKSNLNKIFISDSLDKEEFEKSNNLNLLKMKHIEDMRNHILSYKLLNEKMMFLNSNASININKCNIILFGPSGSGKSSFIKTLYRAVYGTPHLPPDVVNKLIIKDRDQNEGTLCFTRLHLKEENSQSSGIIVCDTRGHIWMNEEEKEQFKVIIEGNIKEDTEIVQTKNRNPFLLWEFWKRDAEMFPKEIFNAKEVGLDSIPHNLVFVFDGSNDEVIDQNDEKFYRELVEISYRKGKIMEVYIHIYYFNRLWSCSCNSN